MKNKLRILSVIAVLMLCSCNTFAQKTEVTKFLGIPVDGTKTTMIQKLKAKGFKHNVATDYLEGEFNGRNVTLSVVTNNNKVYRIMVRDAVASNESDIKIRFNKLCRQFKNNDKYIPNDFVGNFEISDSEDISYEMTVHNKRYEAVYFQNTFDSNALKNMILEKYTEEQWNNADEQELLQMTTELSTKYYDMISHNSVWFMISYEYGKYRILMFYDNEYNAANGEDL